jgi:ATP-dependent DNA helicase RecQ
MRTSDPQAVLSSTFGHSSFRPGQRAVIEAALIGDDILAIMPSGAGKSLCFQLPAVMRPGLTLVISPLIALMRDQVRNLRKRGIRAAMLSSSNDDEEDERALTWLGSRELKLLYVSPERFARPSMLDLLRASTIACIVVDEAHCISHWGHGFRPDYLAIGPVCTKLAARSKSGRLQVLAVTATADAKTRAEIIAQLFPHPPKLFVQSFDRPNIHLRMARRRMPDRQVLDFLLEHPGQTGIIYCARRRHTEGLAELLKANGYKARAYHAGLAHTERTKVEREFQSDDAIVIVATIAFGMGVDRPDVRFICHADTPTSVETYYQEIGRAGRDGLPAFTLALYEPAEFALQRQGIMLEKRDLAARDVNLARSQSLVRLCTGWGCRRQALLAHFEETSGRCGSCDWCEAGLFRKLALRAGL